MPKLVWDKDGERFYETGVDRGVLFPSAEAGGYDEGVAWNGLTAVTEAPSGAEANPQYADNIKYLNLLSAEEVGATIEAFTYPDEFAECDGTAEPAEGLTISQQTRKRFGLCYRTRVGNDLEASDHGYKIHILYGCQAAPSEKAYATINDSPEPLTFSWEVTTNNVEVGEGFKPTALVTIDSRKVPAVKLSALEDMLYGTAEAPSKLPMPAEIITLLGT